MAFKTIGTTLVKTNGTPKTLADLTSIGAFGIVSTEIDVTTLDSANGFKEAIMGLKDIPDVALKGIMKSPDNFEDMYNYCDTQVLNNYRIQFTDGSKFDFQAYIKEWKMTESTVDGVMGFEGMLRVNGKPTLTIANGVSA